jgi:hypothetical protein
MIPMTCEDANVVFDVLDYEADDHDETWVVFEWFASTVGS